MSSKSRILENLRKNQPTFKAREIDKRRKVVNMSDTSPAQLQARFIKEAEALSCQVYLAEDKADTVRIILKILGDNKQVIAWEDSALPFPLSATLHEHQIDIMPANDTQTLYGISGVDSALASTGSLIVQSKSGQARAVSLLPDHHIALVKREQLLPDLETWAQQQHASGFDAFKNSSNTVIISGPSKTADIAQELIKGAHGPRKVHIILLD